MYLPSSPCLVLANVIFTVFRWLCLITSNPQLPPAPAHARPSATARAPTAGALSSATSAQVARSSSTRRLGICIGAQFSAVAKDLKYSRLIRDTEYCGVRNELSEDRAALVFFSFMEKTKKAARKDAAAYRLWANRLWAGPNAILLHRRGIHDTVAIISKPVNWASRVGDTIREIANTPKLKEQDSDILLALYAGDVAHISDGSGQAISFFKKDSFL
ncbi:hypothetical protein EI94DRAFT_1695933 [Lactarius quietus]|nr:hypothetical protein EI94DRAFT_1695933 [Lactarius quietus]